MNGPASVVIKLPISYRTSEVVGVWDHEIGTHFIRRFNERFQPWGNNKQNKYGLEKSLKTEEGVASVNQCVRGAWEKRPLYMHTSALKYFACTMATEMGFCELFKVLEKYITNGRERFSFCTRIKRGMTDTSQPGGYYKDKVYLEGAVEYLQGRKSMDIIALHSSKLSFEDLKKPNVTKILNKQNIVLPPILENMDKYMEALDFIA